MAKKSKNKKTKKHNKNAQLQGLSAAALINRAQSALSAGKARDAVECLKTALKKEKRTEEIHPLLFRAYIERSKELRGKGMHTEAGTVLGHAMACKPADTVMQEADMAAYISISTEDQAFTAYAGYLQANPPSAEVERGLVNHLIRSGSWHLLEGLDSSAPICRDVPPVPDAVEKMNQGQWEEGLEALRSIPRSSPYAPLKLLCRAMSAFYRKDDADLKKAADMLPDDFLPAPAVKQLSGVLNDPDRTAGQKKLPAVELLLEGPLGTAEKMKALIENIKRQRLKQTQKGISDMARAISPENKKACIEAILEILSSTARIEGSSRQDFFYELVEALLPRENAIDLLTRMDIFDDWPLIAAAEYIPRIAGRFTDPRQQSIAKSLVLLHAFKQSLQARTLPEEWLEALGSFGKDFLKSDWQMLGIRCENPDENPDTAYLEIAREGIACDPENREWYEEIVKLPRYAREHKKIVEEALEKMAAHFPQDPFPHLELAALHQQKGAYRKAEKAIGEAARLAPYDSRVIERKAISCLISAEKNLKRGKYHLVKEDLKNARAQASRRAEPFIRAKLAALDLLSHPSESTGDPNTCLDHRFADLAGLDRACALLCLALSLDQNPAAEKTRQADEARSLELLETIRVRIEDEIRRMDGLDAAGIRRLIDPVPPEFGPAMPHSDPQTVAGLLPEPKIAQLLAGVEESEILPVCDQLLEIHWYDTACKELSRRLGEADDTAGRPLMAFYQTVLADLSGETTDVDRLFHLIDNADDTTYDHLEEAAFKLAGHARSKMKIALHEFDFDILEDTNAFDEICDIFSEEDGPPLEDKAAEYYEGMTPEETIADLEGIIDRMGFRDASDYVLETMRPLILNLRPETAAAKGILETFPSDSLAQLSREARVLFLKKY